jgi:hypothetical protein
VVVLSFGLNALMYSFIAEVTPGDLASISKHTESWAEVAGLLSWKAVELAIHWFKDYDGENTIHAALQASRFTDLSQHMM